MVLGFCVLGSGGVGWLLGPFVGNAVFGWRYRGLRGEIERVSLLVFLACWGMGNSVVVIFLWRRDLPFFFFLFFLLWERRAFLARKIFESSANILAITERKGSVCTDQET